MRKLFWSCTAACVLAAGVYVTARNVLQDRQYLVHDQATEGGANLVEKLCSALRSLGGGHGAVADAGGRCGRDDFQVPADPVAVPCEEKIPALPMAGVIEEVPSMPEDMAPATAVIHEEEEPVDGTAPIMPGSGSTVEVPACPTGKKVCAMPPASTCGTGKPTSEGALHMPTCAESDAQQTMPPAEEPAAKTADETEQDETSGSSEDAEESDPMANEPSPETSSPYHHDSCPSGSYCPYTGRCYPTPSAPYTEPATPKTDADKATGKDETSEPKAPAGKHSSLMPKRVSLPNESGIDTMEYRRSDGSLNETDGGPY